MFRMVGCVAWSGFVLFEAEAGGRSAGWPWCRGVVSVVVGSVVVVVRLSRWGVVGGFWRYVRGS